MDMDSGRILYEKNKDEKRLIASITKIMTAVVASERGNLDDKVVVGEEVLKMYGSNIYIEVGEELTLRDLLYGLILRSGNDAAVAIAVYIAGSEEKQDNRHRFLGKLVWALHSRNARSHQDVQSIQVTGIGYYRRIARLQRESVEECDNIIKSTVDSYIRIERMEQLHGKCIRYQVDSIHDDCRQ